MRSSPAERSFHTYSWNHLRASGPAVATSSIEVVPIVDSAYGMPRRWATRTTARSPSWFIIRVNPVGANANGRADGRADHVGGRVDVGHVVQDRRLELQLAEQRAARGAG